MSKIDKLIEELCPDGVEYVQLGEVGTYTRGVTYSKSQEDTSGPVRVLRANNINLGSNTLNFEDVKRVSGEVRIRADQLLRSNDILISAASGSREHVGKVAFIGGELPNCAFGGFMAVVRANDCLEPRFLFHILTSTAFAEHIHSKLASTTINNLNAAIVLSFATPIPPLPIQHAIVDILDKFTELEAELEAELAARKKQYEYYRDALLTFDEDGGAEVDWVQLEEVLQDLRTGLNPRKNFALNVADATGYYVTVRELDSFGVRFHPETARVTPDAIVTIDNRSRLKAGDVLLSGTGTIGRTAIVPAGELNWNIKEGVYALTLDHSRITSRYFVYLIQTTRFNQKLQALSDGGTVRSISMKRLQSLQIPIPPREVQMDITRLLDNFHTLTTDLSSGLPAELEARRKQYEYYRDRLLTFKEKVA